MLANGLGWLVCKSLLSHHFQHVNNSSTCSKSKGKNLKKTKSLWVYFSFQTRSCSKPFFLRKIMKSPPGKGHNLLWVKCFWQEFCNPAHGFYATVCAVTWSSPRMQGIFVPKSPLRSFCKSILEPTLFVFTDRRIWITLRDDVPFVQLN